jgi:hypothetical protein
MIEVNYGLMDEQVLANYLNYLIGRLYKILPIQENEPETLKPYLESLQIELVGNSDLIKQIRYDAKFLELLGTIQYFINNQCEHNVYRKEIFKCISIIKKLLKQYGGG